jgi:hypothetical protein
MKIPNDLKAQCKDISLLLEAKADILSEKYFPNVVQPASRCPEGANIQSDFGKFHILKRLAVMF